MVNFHPRSYPEAQLVRQQEPYHFQRLRHRLGEYPRPSQPNISQPNQLPTLQGWGMSTQDYWNGVFQDYLKRRKALTQRTALELGRL